MGTPLATENLTNAPSESGSSRYSSPSDDLSVATLTPAVWLARSPLLRDVLSSSQPLSESAVQRSRRLLIQSQHTAIRRVRVQHDDPVLLGHDQVGEPRRPVRLTSCHYHPAVNATRTIPVTLQRRLSYHERTRADTTRPATPPIRRQYLPTLDSHDPGSQVSTSLSTTKTFLMHSL